MATIDPADTLVTFGVEKVASISSVLAFNRIPVGENVVAQCQQEMDRSSALTGPFAGGGFGGAGV